MNQFSLICKSAWRNLPSDSASPGPVSVFPDRSNESVRRKVLMIMLEEEGGEEEEVGGLMVPLISYNLSSRHSDSG